MRHPPPPGGKNGSSPRPRTRGAIRTHLGRKRLGPRGRPGRESAHRLVPGSPDARQQEDRFDRLLGAFQDLFAQAGETTAAAFERALDGACDALVAAGEFTADNAERLRQLLRRDLLQREHPGMTFRTGDITTAGTLTCSGCGWTVRTSRTTVLPPCPRCVDTSYRKSG